MADHIRLTRDLAIALPSPAWPIGAHPASLAATRPIELHALLAAAYRNGFGSVAAFDEWWTNLVEDPEFDPALVFIAADENANPVGLAQCWTSGFVKDLVVAETWRGRGLGRALLVTAFHAFASRGLTHVDLKVETGNATARRLYQSLGMVEAPTR